MDFINGDALLTLCRENNLYISEVMKYREMNVGGFTQKETEEKMTHVIEIMEHATHNPLKNPQKSIGGLIGGEAKAVEDYAKKKKPVCGDTLSKAIAYAMAVLEVNASMGLIVAAPTAGSSGVVPGTLIAAKETYGLSEEILRSGLYHASAIGYLLMRNASVSGAEAGCQAEVGTASAMAASALVEMLGGTPEQSLQAASLAISNLLGLVCDPIAGLVEVPCQSRNVVGVSNAFTCAQLALSGVKHPIPFDEMVAAMYKVGRSIPFELRETAEGGCAGTPTGCSLCK